MQSEPGQPSGRFLACLLAGLCALAGAVSAWADPVPYEARYSVYRNGKLTGKLEIVLERNGDAWEIRSDAAGTHGLARILRASDRERVTGRLADGRFVPQKYVRHTRVAGIDNHWDTTFDWPADTVTVEHDGKDIYTLPLGGEAMDPLSLKLEMRRRLRERDPDLKFQMVEEDEIDEQNFRLLEPEPLETALGCVETFPVEKIRRADSRRYTRAWHAPAFGNLEVRVEHGKTGGDHVEMRIAELIYNGRAVEPSPGCAAMQATRQPAENGDS